MVRWTIVLESKADGGWDGADVIGIRTILKNALRWHGLKCVMGDCERVCRDDEERREALAEFVKRELAGRVAAGKGSNRNRG
jgi:hypothetical protein